MNLITLMKEKWCDAPCQRTWGITPCFVWQIGQSSHGDPIYFGAYHLSNLLADYLHSWMLQDFLSHTEKNDEKLEKEFNVLTCP